MHLYIFIYIHTPRKSKDQTLHLGNGEIWHVTTDLQQAKSVVSKTTNVEANFDLAFDLGLFRLDKAR